jgi:hypothetical protein
MDGKYCGTNSSDGAERTAQAVGPPPSPPELVPLGPQAVTEISQSNRGIRIKCRN